MGSFLHDLRSAWRMFINRPGFCLVATLTLAIGIGSSSSVFNLIHGVLLTPPPYLKPEQIVLIRPVKADGQPYLGGTTGRQWTEWRKESASFATMAGYIWTFDYLVQPGGSEFFQGMEVTPDYFKVIGMQPLLGRAFVDAEATVAGDTVTILGYDFWQRRFNGDPNILGQTIKITRAQPPLTIIGVMPPGLRFLPAYSNADFPNYDPNARVDYWIPVTAERSQSEWNVVARLRPGIALAQANAELAAIAARQAQMDRQLDGLTARAKRLETELNQDGRHLLLPLLGAVGLVFLIACGNVASLLLARGLQRQHEYAVRGALGAGRFTLFRQVLTESMLLALAGGVLGAIFSMSIVKVLRATSGAAIPRLDAVTISWPVLFYCCLTALVAAGLAGLLPAFRAWQLNPVEGIKGAGPTTTVSRTQRRLFASVAILQTALTLALLVGSGLLVRTVTNLTKLQPGFGTEHILTMNVTVPSWDGKQWYAFHRRALDKISALPGVRQAAFGWGLPLTGDKWISPVHLENEPAKMADADAVLVAKRSVTPEFFDALGMRIVAGRAFRASDNLENWKAWSEFVPSETPFVCIINESLAERYFPNSNAVGHIVRVGPWIKRPCHIVGVLANARMETLTQAAGPELYLPFFQCPVFNKHLLVRARSEPASLIDMLRGELRAIEPTIAVEHVKTLEQIRTESMAGQLFAMRLLIGFAVTGCLLALVGIYSVLALSVSSRRRELAVRLAVGAEPPHIRRLVLGEGLRLVILGQVLGVGAALAMARIFQALLFGVKPLDPATWLAVTSLFTFVTLFACWLPARAAGRIAPVEAMH
jgi:putative ABC transport system permease protein